MMKARWDGLKTYQDDNPHMRDFSIVETEKDLEEILDKRETVSLDKVNKRYALAPSPCMACEAPDMSGRKDRVMISCAAFDVPAVVRPIAFYETRRVHLLSGTDETDERNHILTEFRDEIISQINDDGYARVEEYRTDVHNYKKIMRTLLTIVRDEMDETNGKVEIFVNISSGTPEYSAAAMLICMQNRLLTPFTVRTREYSIKPDDLKKMLYKKGKPLGQTSEIYDPVAISTCNPDIQDSELVTCLGVMKELSETKKTAVYEDIINSLISEGAWRYVPDSKRGRSDDLQKARMHLKRHFLEPMERKGWLRQDSLNKKRYYITDEGDNIIEIYYGLEK